MAGATSAADVPGSRHSDPPVSSSHGVLHRVWLAHDDRRDFGRPGRIHHATRRRARSTAVHEQSRRLDDCHPHARLSAKACASRTGEPRPTSGRGTLGGALGGETWRSGRCGQPWRPYRRRPCRGEPTSGSIVSTPSRMTSPTSPAGSSCTQPRCNLSRSGLPTRLKTPGYRATRCGVAGLPRCARRVPGAHPRRRCGWRSRRG